MHIREGNSKIRTIFLNLRNNYSCDKFKQTQTIKIQKQKDNSHSSEEDWVQFIF